MQISFRYDVTDVMKFIGKLGKWHVNNKSRKKSCWNESQLKTGDIFAFVLLIIFLDIDKYKKYIS